MRILIDKTFFLLITKQSCDFIVPLRRYDYICNDTVIMSPKKFRDFQWKCAIVTMAMKDMSRTE